MLYMDFTHTPDLNLKQQGSDAAVTTCDNIELLKIDFQKYTGNTRTHYFVPIALRQPTPFLLKGFEQNNECISFVM